MDNTLWSADQHTFAKHDILRNYLGAWMPKITNYYQQKNRAKKVNYFDAFAGPGEYLGGELGSPSVAVAVANNHRPFGIPVEMTFVENDIARSQHLEAVLKEFPLKRNGSTLVKCCDCQQLLYQHFAAPKVDPTLVFLDQFGYTAVSMDLIEKILKPMSCEVIAYLNYDGMNRFITDETKWESMTAAFGHDGWKAALHKQGRNREPVLRQAFEDGLRQQGNARYVTSFQMMGNGERLLYYLFFASNSLHGLREMKPAMRKVAQGIDARGQFMFADSNAALPLLGIGYDDDWLAAELRKRLAGKTITVAEIEVFVLEHTPCHVFRKALNLMKKNNWIESASNDGQWPKKGAWAEEVLVRFKKPDIQTGFSFD